LAIIIARLTDRRGETIMPIEFNHTIVWSQDSKASATFLARMLGLSGPKQWGPFQIVTTDNGVNVDFMDKDGKIATQHYAFLVDEAEFDEIFSRIREQGLSFWADPGRTKGGEINTHDGGRGVYFKDPNGHLLEVITRPYSSSGRDP
jgi:catechol 2,3-dioxygenase-like lactoylglutathione lyase family enzyme